MITHDPDVVRWGLHTLMDTCCLPTTSQVNLVTRYEDVAAVTVGYVGEQYVDGEEDDNVVNNVENDASIARALQEEYSRTNAGVDSVDMEGSQTDMGGGSDRCNREADDTSVSALERQHEELLHLWNTAEESARDGEVGKILNDNLLPVLHVPKINGEIPSADEEISDHQRLLDRLMVYELIENKIQGDGNCQFRAISDQLYRSSKHHKFVREQVVQQLKCFPEAYDGYVPMGYKEYVNKMSKSGEWGDHVTLQAAADSYGVKIFLITSFKDTCYIEILPKSLKSSRVIFLSFWAEVHYNSIYPEGELPLVEKKKHKKLWERFTI